jgi:predicted nucleic acid-binding protein
MHVLIDTNVILDVLEKREPFYRASNDVLSLCASKKIHGFIAFHSVSNIFYILRKRYSAEERRHLLLGILKFLQVANVNHENVQHALERDDFSDFEDCLQDECAAQNHAEYIITRNTNDFSTSNIPAITPSDMLSRI